MAGLAGPHSTGAPEATRTAIDDASYTIGASARIRCDMALCQRPGIAAFGETSFPREVYAGIGDKTPQLAPLTSHKEKPSPIIPCSADRRGDAAGPATWWRQTRTGPYPTSPRPATRRWPNGGYDRCHPQRHRPATTLRRRLVRTRCDILAWWPGILNPPVEAPVRCWLPAQGGSYRCPSM